MSDVDPHQHLFDNLLILNELKPGDADFVKCLKEDMFCKPNRTAFDQVLYYLCHTYDPVGYKSKVPWPILDRSQERTFRQNTVAFIKDILQARPEARIPSFSPSFLSTPGGDRLAKFIWKFSLLVLKTAVEKQSGDVVLDYPTAGLHFVEALTESVLKETKEEIDRFCSFLIGVSSLSETLKNDLEHQNEELRRLQSEMVTLVQSFDFLSEHEKSLLLSNNTSHWKPVAEKWLHTLSRQADDEAAAWYKSIETQSDVIQCCYRSVKSLVNSKTLPVVLNASRCPSKLKDRNENLDLSKVFFESSNAAASICKTISMNGGFQSLDSIVPTLQSMCEQLQNIKISLIETKVGYANLISEPTASVDSLSTLNGEAANSPLKRGLKLGHEMLQDAQMSTPPLVFNVDYELPSKFVLSSESPPMESLIRKQRSVVQGRYFGTPKASVSSLRSGLNSRAHGNKSLKAEAQGFSMVRNVIQTPAHFGTTRPVTSTVCKQASSSTLGNKLLKVEVPSCSKNTDVVQTPKHVEIACPTTSPICKLTTSPNSTSGSSLPSAKIVKTSRGQKIQGDHGNIFARGEDRLTTTISLDKTKNKIPSNPSVKISSNVCNADLKIVPSQDVAAHKPLCNLTQDIVTLTEQSSVLLSVLEKSTLCQEKNGASNTIQDPMSSCLDTTFESPQSCGGLLSSDSLNNTIFSNDSFAINPGTAVPDLEFDSEFEEDVSPSGRVSLCPASVEMLADKEVVQEPQTNLLEVPVAKPSCRRQSLQALISRYYEITASSKAYKPVEISPCTSPELKLSSGDTLSTTLQNKDLNFGLELDQDLV